MKWVSLKDRKPDKGKTWDDYESLIFTDGEFTWVAYYTNYSNASHWLEFDLPPLPKEEKPKDADWDRLKKDYERFNCSFIQNTDSNVMIHLIYELIKAKYGNKPQA